MAGARWAGSDLAGHRGRFRTAWLESKPSLHVRAGRSVDRARRRGHRVVAGSDLEAGSTASSDDSGGRPHARVRGRLVHSDIIANRAFGDQIDRLHSVVAKAGGRSRILACGQPVTDIAFQSILAWDIGENVADVGWDPSTSIATRKPIVLFEDYGIGWKVRPIHSNRASCTGLSTDTRFGWILLQPGRLLLLHAIDPSAWL